MQLERKFEKSKIKSEFNQKPILAIISKPKQNFYLIQCNRTLRDHDEKLPASKM